MTAGTDVNSFKNHLSLTLSHERDLSLFHSDPSPTQASDSEGAQVHGKVVRLNGCELALFYYKDKFYAVTEKCPHMGTSMYVHEIVCTSLHAVGSAIPSKLSYVHVALSPDRFPAFQCVC